MVNSFVRLELGKHWQRSIGLGLATLALILWLELIPRDGAGVVEVVPAVATGYPMLAAATLLLRTRLAQGRVIRTALWTVIGLGAMFSVALFFGWVDGKL